MGLTATTNIPRFWTNVSAAISGVEYQERRVKEAELFERSVFCSGAAWFPQVRARGGVGDSGMPKSQRVLIYDFAVNWWEWIG